MISEEDKVIFRNLLQEEKLKIIETSQRTIDDGATEVERAADEVDQASNDLNQSLTLRFRDRDRKLLNKINKALSSIDEGTYGECEECGEPISKKRLLARPVSTLCIDCKEKQERNERAFVERRA